MHCFCLFRHTEYKRTIGHRHGDNSVRSRSIHAGLNILCNSVFLCQHKCYLLVNNGTLPYYPLVILKTQALPAGPPTRHSTQVGFYCHSSLNIEMKFHFFRTVKKSNVRQVQNRQYVQFSGQ